MSTSINRMLIDATHPEETRVVVQRGQRIEEFDFESAARRQLRGNIYLAKVTRVEPSLQAAFVEYGGNRHGFLAFSEIHPDYYQIPVADREALLAEEARFVAEEEERERKGQRGRDKRRGSAKAALPSPRDSVSTTEPESSAAVDGAEAPARIDEAVFELPAPDAPARPTSNADEPDAAPAAVDDPDTEASEDDETDEEEPVEQLGGGDALDDLHQERVFRPRRQYKIQEVIKRRQILLVQVVKEERGNKGAALTTYLSLAGRYCVLMPNSARGGGISRKITNSADRKRLKELASDLDVPDGMGVILRTAGATRTKPEIKRDFEYLLRVWEQVRETTLNSVAPTLVYEEGSLIKRAIRDLYSKEIEEIVVAGDEGYREAKAFMKMLMPAQAKSIVPYRDPQPIFARHGVEHQLDALFANSVTLPSGGYIVISPTEALVAIDVNSGRSTREHNIEDTALKTNLEAAEEVARQLRLRDLAGLIVIDFIDMEEKRNNRLVEKKLKDCLKNDRARIQLGRISHFGLLEMSRQRMRTGVIESSTQPCPHCGGSGVIRSTPSVALHILRGIEESLLKSAQHHLIVKTRTDVALYMLNQKRLHLRDMEKRFSITITVLADDGLHGANYYVLERGEFAPNGGYRADAERELPTATDLPDDDSIDDGFAVEAEADSVEEPPPEAETTGAGEDNGTRRRRRRRGGRGRGRDEQPRNMANGTATDESAEGEDDAEGDDQATDAAGAAEAEGAPGESGGRRRRRRGRRGGRRHRREHSGADEHAVIAAETATDHAPEALIPAAASTAEPTAQDVKPGGSDEAPVTAATVEEPPTEEPAKKPRARRKKADAAAAPAEELAVAAEPPVEAGDKPRRASRSRKKVEAVEASSPAEEAVVTPAPESVPPPVTKEERPAAPAVVAVAAAPPPVVEEVDDPNRPKRTGWWAKARKALGG